MNTTKYLSSQQVSHIWTTYSPTTIRDFAEKGKLPVAFWVGQEPLFARSAETIHAMLRLGCEEGKSNGHKRQ